MDSKYLLLRNGRQSGPFTIGELLQQQLRASDMIWIENKSTAWCYLSEMELSPEVSEKLPAQNQNIPSTSPDDEIERKAEELRKRALAYAPQHHYPGMDASSRPVKRQAAINKDEEVFHFVDHRKERKSVGQEVVMSLLIIAIFGASIYGSKSYFNNNQEMVPVAHKMEATDQHTANGVSMTAGVSSSRSIPTEPETLQDPEAGPEPVLSSSTPETETPLEKPKPSTPKITKKKAVDTTVKAESTTLKDEAFVPPVVKENPDTNSLKPIVPEEKKDTTVQETKKKKGWGLFRKKKKEE